MTALAQRIKETPMAPYIGLISNMTDEQKHIVVTYINELMEKPNQMAESEAERQFRSLRGCWADDPEDADRMVMAIREAREQDDVREIMLDD